MSDSVAEPAKMGPFSDHLKMKDETKLDSFATLQYFVLKPATLTLQSILTLLILKKVYVKFLCDHCLL